MNVPIVPLGQLCEMDRQGVHPDDPIAAGLPFVGVEHVESDSGAFNFNSGSRVGSQRSTTFRFDERHVLYARLRPYLNKVATPEFAGRCSTELVPLLPRDGVEREFIAYLLRRKGTVDYVMSSVTGARMPRTDMRALMSLSVPLPSLDEQRRIVGILNRAAKIERLRARARELMGEFIPALFVRMFGDPFENAMGWYKEKLGSLGTLDRGRSRHRPRNAPELYGGPYPFVQTGDIAKSHGMVKEYSQSYSEIGLSQSKIWPSGTLCITIAANIGMTATLTFDACFPDSVVGFLAGDDVAIPYIQTVIDLMQKRIEEDAPKAAQRNINLKVLRGLLVPVPPLEMQNQYAQVVETARSTIAAAESGSGTTSELGASLMSRLLRDGA